MAFNIIPKEEKFFELFEAQAAHNEDAARTFRELMKNWSLQSPAFDKLRDIEHEADITTHEIIDKLNRTFVTPFDREDIHELASKMDDIVDILQSLSLRMQLYGIQRVTEDLIAMSETVLHAVECLRKAVPHLKDLRETRRILDYCIEINRLENAGDNALAHAISNLFKGKPDPLEVIKWKEIYEGTEEAIDRCEDVANTIEGIVVKQG
ncbi:MAG: DUF47 domain-containing protein [Elusimicrobia bacterium]|nr:DUF47 domain-containing protein [Elusimicrobiota bacterium]